MNIKTILYEIYFQKSVENSIFVRNKSNMQLMLTIVICHDETFILVK